MISYLGGLINLEFKITKTVIQRLGVKKLSIINHISKSARLNIE